MIVEAISSVPENTVLSLSKISSQLPSPYTAFPTHCVLTKITDEEVFLISNHGQ